MYIEEFLRSKNIIKYGFSKFIINGDFGFIDLESLINEFAEAQQQEIEQLKEEIRILKQYAEISRNDKHQRKARLNEALEEIKELKK